MVDLKIQLPEHFLDEEVRCDYTVTRQMKEVWAVELDLLAEFDRVCKLHGIKYVAYAGTALGAVRHKGFIPWDDDIDLTIDRENYEKLCDVAYEFKEPYFFQTQETDPGSYRGHAQLRRSDTTGILKSELARKFSFNQGIFIDIFPIDRIPDDPEEQKRYFDELDKYKTRYSLLHAFYRNPGSNDPKKRAIKLFFNKVLNFVDPKQKLLSHYFWKVEKLKLKYKDSDYKYGLNIAMTRFKKRRSVKPIDMANYSLEPVMADFEFIQIPLPNRYEADIIANFGKDYMVYKKWGQAHGGVIFDAGKSYREYLNL